MGNLTAAATPTQVGTCKWCGTSVFSDEPRLSHYDRALVWHLTCAELCRDLLADILPGSGGQ